MAQILVLSGAGRYADPWHPFAETSAAIAETLQQARHHVQVRPTDSPDALRFEGIDLVVVNTGVGADPAHPAESDPAWDEGFVRFGEFLDGGGVALGTHTAANTFRDWPRWIDELGGEWVRGTSMHPERSVAVFESVPENDHHPIIDDLGLVLAYDERYSFLELSPQAVPLMQHETADQFHTCVWAHGRTVYDGLGHDARSYDSASRRELLLREIDWLLSLR